jgi:hypothetical protein
VQKGSFGRPLWKAHSLLVESSDSAQAIVAPKDAAESAGLQYISDERPGIRRKKAGSGFTYTRADGSRLTERDALKRLKALAPMCGFAPFPTAIFRRQAVTPRDASNTVITRASARS